MSAPQALHPYYNIMLQHPTTLCSWGRSHIYQENVFLWTQIQCLEILSEFFSIWSQELWTKLRKMPLKLCFPFHVGTHTSNAKLLFVVWPAQRFKITKMNWMTLPYISPKSHAQIPPSLHSTGSFCLFIQSQPDRLALSQSPVICMSLQCSLSLLSISCQFSTVIN